jgi:type II secretory pathway component PulF
MVGSGLSVTESYSDVVKVISFLPLKRVLAARITDLEGGMPLHKVLNAKKVPEHVIAMVLAGESTGMLGDALIRSANVIDVDLSGRLKRLTALIEPLMMIVIGGIVGSISLSIMMPIYEMSKILQHAN